MPLNILFSDCREGGEEEQVSEEEEQEQDRVAMKHIWPMRTDR